MTEPKKVLTVDDSKSMRSIVAKAISELPIQVLEAEDGQQGLAAIIEHRPDLVVLDITMPVMDGPTMLKELRGMGDKTPVILLTAESGSAIIGPLMPLGFSDYIVKPFKPEELVAKVVKALGPGAAAAPAPRAQSAPMTTPGPKGVFLTESRPLVDILFIDDMENVSKQFRTFVGDEIKIHHCANGQAALKSARDHIYRAVLVDVDIPDVEVASLVRQLRALQATATFVGLFMRTAKSPAATAQEKGLDGVLVKPFDADQVTEFLSACFQSNEVLVAEDHRLRAIKFSGTREGELRYFSRLNKSLDENLERIAAACYPAAILDMNGAPNNPTAVIHLVRTAAEYAAQLGIQLKLVAGGEMKQLLGSYSETAELPTFETVQAAEGK